jgi:hypothetical protein
VSDAQWALFNVCLVVLFLGAQWLMIRHQKQHSKKSLQEIEQAYANWRAERQRVWRDGR